MRNLPRNTSSSSRARHLFRLFGVRYEQVLSADVSQALDQSLAEIRGNAGEKKDQGGDIVFHTSPGDTATPRPAAPIEPFTA